MAIAINDIKRFLDEKYVKYASPSFIATDPIQIPRAYTNPKDIEVAAFLTATISWGQRAQIVSHAKKLLEYMGDPPYEFIMSNGNKASDSFSNYVYRTFNGVDCKAFLNALRQLYQYRGGLQRVFTEGYYRSGQIQMAIHHFRTLFINEQFPSRSRKHVPDVMSGSAAKRLNMFLRWMVRPSREGVDFGIWSDIPPSALMLPLDVHSGRVARSLGLLSRKQNDWRAVEEVTQNLRTFDPSDPIKYDFALFGLGVFEKF